MRFGANSMSLKNLLIASLIPLFLSCGAKDHQIAITLTPLSALQDVTVADIVAVATSVDGPKGILDSDGNGTPDTFGYPDRCGSAFAAGCGVPVAQAGTFALGKLPLGYTFKLEITLRDQSANSKYSGSATFNNTSSTSSVSIAVTP